MKERSDACPRCASRRIVLGEMTRGHTIGPGEPFNFRAFASRLSIIRKGAKVSQNMAACANCGLVWGEVSVDKLLQHLELLPSQDVSTWLRSRHNTPL